MTLTNFHKAAMTYASEHIAALDADRLGTPIEGCEGWTAADLVGHLAMVNTMCRNSTLGKGPDQLPTPEDLVGDDALGAYTATAAAFTAAYANEAEVFAKDMPTPVGMYPGSVVMTQGTLENLVHGWDLARSLGREATIPAELIGEALGRILGAQPLYQQFFEMEFYSPSVDVGPDAGPQDRLMAYLGRTT